ncbi:hypothetical protein ACDI55_28465, partial [Klebsiella pneumoniae]|uniref:hypothetical protein n=1 Tax=Klebsiella pneumoniae TaxID=573 RepID=UPI00353238B3
MKHELQEAPVYQVFTFLAEIFFFATMTPVYQVFIMVLVQGATRSGFHHRTDLFFFTFATKVPVSRFSPRHFFFFFEFFWRFIKLLIN